MSDDECNLVVFVYLLAGISQMVFELACHNGWW